MKTVTAYLNFDANCRQAMSFYQQCHGTELRLKSFSAACRGRRMPCSQLRTALGLTLAGIEPATPCLQSGQQNYQILLEPTQPAQ
jgi:hypothetical protein